MTSMAQPILAHVLKFFICSQCTPKHAHKPEVESWHG